MAPVWFSAVFASLMSAGLLLQTALLVRAARRAGLGVSPCLVKRCICDLATWLRCRCCETGAQHDETPRLDELIKKEIDAKRVTYGRRCLMCVLAMFSAGSVNILAVMALGSPRSLTWRHDLLIMLCYLLALALVVFPALTKVRALDAWHCIFMILVILFVSPLVEDDPKNVVVLQTYVMMCGIFFGILNLNIRVSFFTNMIHLVCMVSFSAAADDDDLLTREIAIFFAKIGILLCWELALNQGTKRQVEAKSVRGQQAAVSSLLGMMCDSVVELDEKLCFVEHVPSLASALFLGSGKSMQGEPFKRYMCDEEDQKLLESLAQVPADDPSSAPKQMFHTKLRDAWGNIVRMEFFHVPFFSIDDSLHHIIGIKEQSDTKACGAPTATGESVGPEDVVPELSNPMPQHPAGPEARLADSVAHGLLSGQQSAARGRSRSRSRSASSRRSGANETSVLQIDVVATDELPVVFASSPFKAKYGSPEKLSERIHEPQVFAQWLSSVADEIYGGARLPKIEEFGSLKMRGEGAADAGSCDSWRTQVCFPSPNRDRQSYAVSIRLVRQSSGTAAVAEHHALSENVMGVASAQQSGRQMSL